MTKDLKKQIKISLSEFQELKNSGNPKWFNELCFCLLTANSKATSAISIQLEMNPDGFAKKTRMRIAAVIKNTATDYHNTKAEYIFLARKFIDIKDALQNMSSFEARDFLVKNVKGLGLKEASHFLRNVGYNNVAIINKHILRFLKNENLIKEIPKTISKKKYLEFFQILSTFNISQSELDLIIWSHMAGKVLK